VQKDLPGELLSKSKSAMKKKKFKGQRMLFCNKIMRELFAKKHYNDAWVFYEAVDYVALQIPDYLEKIKTPMDFGTAKAKLDEGKYTEADDYVRDIRLVFENCYTYNPPDHPVVAMAKKMQAVFEKAIEEMPPKPTPPPRAGTLGADSDSDDEHDAEHVSAHPIIPNPTPLIPQEPFSSTAKKEKMLPKKKKDKAAAKAKKASAKAKKAAAKALQPEPDDGNSSSDSSESESESSEDDDDEEEKKKKKRLEMYMNLMKEELAGISANIKKRKKKKKKKKSKDGKHKRAKTTSTSSVKKAAPKKRAPAKKKPTAEKKSPASRKASSTSGSKRKAQIASEEEDSDSSEGEAHMTYEQKKELSKAIHMLENRQLEKVVTIIQDMDREALGETSDGETEIDFQALKDGTLRQLEAYVHQCNRAKPKAKKKKKTQQEVVEEMIATQKKYAELTGTTAEAGHATPAQSAAADSSSRFVTVLSPPSLSSLAFPLDFCDLSLRTFRLGVVLRGHA
jgi:hypothetical protein